MKEAPAAPLSPKDTSTELKVSAALRMPAVAIDLNSVADALTRSTAVVTVLRGTTACRVLTGFFLVCHGILLNVLTVWAHRLTHSTRQYKADQSTREYDVG
jgi:hypothetical protein